MPPNLHQLDAIERALLIDPSNRSVRWLLHDLHMELIRGPGGEEHTRQALDHLVAAVDGVPAGDQVCRTGIALARMVGDRRLAGRFEYALHHSGGAWEDLDSEDARWIQLDEWVRRDRRS